MAKRKPTKSAAARPLALTLSSGSKVPADGDLVYLIDALYREFALKRGFAPAYADVQRELGELLAQMDSETTRDYFAQSLFLNYVTYENEMADRLAEQITAKAKATAAKPSKRRS